MDVCVCERERENEKEKMHVDRSDGSSHGSSSTAEMSSREAANNLDSMFLERWRQMSCDIIH